MGPIVRPDKGGRSESAVVGRHVREAQACFKGEHQIAQYVARLELAECARILGSVLDGLPRLARLRDECRVGSRETRSFEAVLRKWTAHVLSGAEGG